MVTDLQSQYTSPAGKEFTFAAARFAALHPASRVLDLGCGNGDGCCNLAVEFRCKVTAVDNNAENLKKAHAQAVEKKVSHLITFRHEDIQALDYKNEPFDCIIAEGGILSLIGRQHLVSLVPMWLVSRGWFSFSDLILTTHQSKIPAEILKIFSHQTYTYETEESYRSMIESSPMSIQCGCLVPQSGWDNYYAYMARRLEDTAGFFADTKVKLAFHREIDTFYRYDALRYIGYFIGICRKKK